MLGTAVCVWISGTDRCTQHTGRCVAQMDDSSLDDAGIIPGHDMRPHAANHAGGLKFVTNSGLGLVKMEIKPNTVCLASVKHVINDGNLLQLE